MKYIAIRQDITEIDFQEEWRDSNLVVYANGLGKVRDLVGLLPVIKRLNLKFFLDGAKKENYEAVQILSSLGVYSGIVINEDSDWEKLTDLMYYALCGRVPHAPVEPFQSMCMICISEIFWWITVWYIKKMPRLTGSVFFTSPPLALPAKGGEYVWVNMQP